MPIRILLIEPQRLFREGFRALLRTQPDFEVVGDASDATAAISIAAASRPHVAVVESCIACESNMQLLRELSQLPAPPRLVALGPPGAQRQLFAARERIVGFVCKEDSSDDAFAAIRTIAAGRTYVTPRLLQIANGDGQPRLLAHLTSREREVFDLVLRGHSTSTIAKQLVLSPRTVETHRSHVMRKLGVRSAVDLVRVAAHHGLLPS